MNERLIELAEIVGFDLENGAWCAAPEALEAEAPGIGMALFKLFTCGPVQE